MLKVANSVINASQITGVLPVVNGGTGVTTSTGTGNTVLSASPTLSGDVNLSTGNLVIGTAGKGIDFSATASGSGTMTSELLADYEEGTWTPELADASSGGNQPTYSSRTGNYTKIGNFVRAQLRIEISSKGSMSAVAPLYLRGLPFVAAGNNTNRAASTVHTDNTTFASGYLTAVLPANDTTFNLTNIISGLSSANILVSAIANNFFVIIDMHYQSA